MRFFLVVLLLAPATALLATPKLHAKPMVKKAPRTPEKTMIAVEGQCGRVHANATHFLARAPRNGVNEIIKERHEIPLVERAGKGDLMKVLNGKKPALLSKKQAPGPGAGMDLEAVKKDAFANSYKNGYWYVGCVGDSLMTNADKHGGQGKHRYAGPDVSIVWYHDVVPKEDMEAMQAGVCFDFCSTVKDMNYFGLTRGRECYCAPYYSPAGDAATGNCDTPCEGYMSTMCGNSAGRASMYQMHSCEEK